MKIFQVDAFTNKAFSGNPAGVCILPYAMSDEWMQNVAMEMNLAETAFLLKQDDGYSLRWFTPLVEVELCGHATLASAHILWEHGYLRKDETARFHTLSGLLTASTDGNWIELNFPATPSEEVSMKDEEEIGNKLSEALRATPKYIGKSKFDCIVEVESEEVVRSLNPDFTLLAKLPTRGIIVTSVSSSKDYDFVSRFFAPAVGINEDPVTGSAHCCLGPHWQQKLGKDYFTAYQASKRGGIVKVKVLGDRVSLSGQAVTVISGEI